jgi:hypothetical protein
MAIEKTELQFPYSPPDFFEAQYTIDTDEYTLTAENGLVRVTLRVPNDPIDSDLQNRVIKHVEGLFRIRQLLGHKPFKLNDPSAYQHHSGGTRSISVTAQGGEFLSLVGQCDFVVRDASGEITQDTKAERIQADTEFVNAVMPKLVNSPTLVALLESYNAAVNDPSNELVHLYEIRDALAKYYGGEVEARKKLGVSEKQWKWLGALANLALLQEGRHRGKHSKRRRATPAELDEARKIVRGWIKAFADTI